MPDIQVSISPLESIIDVRHSVLRQNQDRITCYYQEDNQILATHFAATNDKKVIGCASIYKESHPDFSLKQSWRIRGMAVLEPYRNQHIGHQLLDSCINHSIHHKSDVIWCNARIKAVPFYKRSGFNIIGDEFEIENIGKHYLMAKNLGIHSGKSRFLEKVKHLLTSNQAIPLARS